MRDNYMYDGILITQLIKEIQRLIRMQVMIGGEADDMDKHDMDKHDIRIKILYLTQLIERYTLYTGRIAMTDKITSIRIWDIDGSTLFEWTSGVLTDWM